MITGAHLLLHSSNAEADRAFFRDVLQFKTVDAGHGWLIFGLPPAEAGIHPQENPAATPKDGSMAEATLYLMCDDLRATIKWLESKGCACAPVTDAGWGLTTNLRLPSGANLGLYQPRHPTAI